MAGADHARNGSVGIHRTASNCSPKCERLDAQQSASSSSAESETRGQGLDGRLAERDGVERPLAGARQEFLETIDND